MAEIDNFLLLLNQERKKCLSCRNEELFDRLETQYLLEKKASESHYNEVLDFRIDLFMKQQTLIQELSKKHETAVSYFNDLLQKKEEEIRRLTTAISDLTTINENIEKAVVGVEECTKDFYGPAVISIKNLSDALK